MNNEPSSDQQRRIRPKVSLTLELDNVDFLDAVIIAQNKGHYPTRSAAVDYCVRCVKEAYERKRT